MLLVTRLKFDFDIEMHAGACRNDHQHAVDLRLSKECFVTGKGVWVHQRKEDFLK